MSFSDMDKSAYYFAQKCGECHPGGGSLEYDRDGYKYYDDQTGKFGYQLSGRDPVLDGDYTAFSGGDPNFGVPWDKSGVLEADCLMCHLKGYDWKIRSAALNGRKFRWAPAVGAGWAEVEMGKDKSGLPLVKSLTINYNKIGKADFKNLANQIIKKIPAENCWYCHYTADTKKRGRTVDPYKDIHILKMRTCVICHPSDDQHNFAKGDAALSSVRDDLDLTMKTCRDCHLNREYKTAPYPEKHTFPPLHYGMISCEACHIPYKDVPGKLVFDNATTGRTIEYHTDIFLDFDAQYPKRWMPVLKMRRGKIRPFKELISIWWGDLNDKTGVVAPLYLWKIRDLKKPDFKDDNGDGKQEINTFEEIKAFLLALQGARDKFGNPIARNPALAKGGKIYKLAGSGLTFYRDRQAESHGFSISHNVLPATEAIGVKGCKECHTKDSAFFHRQVLLDPCNEEGKPVFVPTWELMGYTEEQVEELTDLESIMEIQRLLYE